MTTGPGPWPPPFSNYTGWAVADPDTECPDCGAQLEGFSGDLDELLAGIDEHLKVCTGTPAAAEPVAPSPWGDRPEPEDPARDRMDDAELASHQAHEPAPLDES
jgi:hypothetical protein